ncbi:DUF3883 domain-containing protein [Pseudonocardia alni]|uniref:DUF3883 domain-containing protein n=1 Tax=Pseudonocardia alni TaxID=33907 RepID=UPI003322546D
MRAVPSAQNGGGLPAGAAARLLSSQFGGTVSEIDQALSFLLFLDLTEVANERLCRTAEGDRLSRRIRQSGPHEFSVFMLRSGLLAEQIRIALSLSSVRSGQMRLPLAPLRRTAPQLVAVLSRLPEVQLRSPVMLPDWVAIELESAWNQVDYIPPATLTGMEHRLAVGERAELYSLQYERSSRVGASAQIIWVSRDDANAGYDIEIRHSSPARCVEVKGSSDSREVVFFLSSNELDKSRTYGQAYEIHYWGGIRLHVRAADDYARLVAAGYPLIISDPSSVLFGPGWECEPTGYRVRKL